MYITLSKLGGVMNYSTIILIIKEACSGSRAEESIVHGRYKTDMQKEKTQRKSFLLLTRKIPLQLPCSQTDAKADAEAHGEK